MGPSPRGAGLLDQGRGAEHGWGPFRPAVPGELGQPVERIFQKGASLGRVNSWVEVEVLPRPVSPTAWTAWIWSWTAWEMGTSGCIGWRSSR